MTPLCTTQLVFIQLNSITGLVGAAGAQGANGVTGAMGPDGDVGPQGVQGDAGAPGITTIVPALCTITCSAVTCEPPTLTCIDDPDSTVDSPLAPICLSTPVACSTPVCTCA